MGRGGKVSSGTAGWYRSYGTDFDNSEIASPALNTEPSQNAAFCSGLGDSRFRWFCVDCRVRGAMSLSTIFLYSVGCPVVSLPAHVLFPLSRARFYFEKSTGAHRRPRDPPAILKGAHDSLLCPSPTIYHGPELHMTLVTGFPRS